MTAANHGESAWAAEFNEVVDRIVTQVEGRIPYPLVYKIAIEEMGYHRPNTDQPLEDRVWDVMSRFQRRKSLLAREYRPELLDVDVHETADGWRVRERYFSDLADAIEYCRPLNGGGFVVVVGKDGDRRRWDEGSTESADWN